MTRSALLLIAIAAFLSGCLTAEERYVGPDDGDGVYAFAVTDDVAPVAVSEEEALYIVETRVELPIEPPEEGDFAELEGGAQEDLPFARLPWVEEDDLRIEVDWTLRNLADGTARVAVTLNGFNEFHEYLPGFTIDDDEVIPNFAQWERDIEVGPLETVSGTIREEEIDEAEVDLATVVNGAPNANQVVYFMNHSAHDPRAEPYIPAVVPGLTGFRIGIRATGFPEAECAEAPCGLLVFEASVRVRDEGDRLAAQDDEPWELPEPEIFMPVLEEEM